MVRVRGHGTYGDEGKAAGCRMPAAYRRGRAVGWLIARFIISPTRNRTGESSISSLYPTTRDVNRFSSMPYRSCHCLDPPKNHDLDYRASKALGTALSVVLLPSSASWITSIMLLSIAFKRIWRRLFASCSVPFTKRSLNSFV